MKRTSGSRKTKPRTKQNQVRMTDAFKARISAYQKKFFENTGAEINFSEAVRALLDQALKRERL